MNIYKIFKIIVILLITLYLLLFLYTKLLRLPSPYESLKVELSETIYTPQLLPYSIVKASSNPIEIPIDLNLFNPPFVNYNTKIDFYSFLTQTETSAFFILKNNKIVFKWYSDNNLSDDFLFPSFSMAKSIIGILIGQLIDDGKLTEENYIIDFFPEMKTGDDFDKITIKNLLDMRSGLALSDNYDSGIKAWVNKLPQMYVTTDTYWFINQNNQMAQEPGKDDYYRSINTQILSMIINKITGNKFTQYLSEKIWQKIGASRNATWNIDKECPSNNIQQTNCGFVKGFCCFNSSANDFIKLGLLLVNNGFINGQKIISDKWMKRLSTPVTTLDYGWGYSAQMWHPYPNINLFMGIHGNYMYIDNNTNTVILKFTNPSKYCDDEKIIDVFKQISSI